MSRTHSYVPRHAVHFVRLPTALAAAMVVAAGTASAQSTASASLDIVAQIITPLSVTVTRSLDFGRMFAGVNKPIAASSATGGRFEVSGQAGSAVSVSLLMPSTLISSAGENLIIGAWSYVVSPNAALTGATPVTFNGGVAAPVAGALSGAVGTGKLYFGIGATAQPFPTQAVGVYTGTGQITAAYTDL